MDNKRKALDVLGSKRPVPATQVDAPVGYGTKNDTNQPSADNPPVEVMDWVVRRAGLEPATPSLKGSCSTG